MNEQRQTTQRQGLRRAARERRPRTRIYRGSRASDGARDLGHALNVPVIKRNGSRFTPRAADTIINWGASTFPPGWAHAGCTIINRPENVRAAVDKLECLTILSESGIPVPQWTTERVVADGWRHGGGTVVVRATVIGSGGEGITILNGGLEPVPPAPLYTKYFNGREEWRIHVANGAVIDRQRKRRRNRTDEQRQQDEESGAETLSRHVRSHANGWVFCREDIVPRNEVDQLAVDAVSALGLDFAAVDIRFATGRNEGVVLEVNTAPGIEGTTLDNYRRALSVTA